jgi:hypothetical protein
VSSDKGPWEKAETLAEILSKAILPIVVVLLGFFISRTLDKNQARDAQSRLNTQVSDADSRLYTELVTKREEADTSLRQSMFESVLKTFLAGRPGDSDRDILHLELLAYNFHETLNLKPLFLHVQEQIAGSKQLPARLVKLAKDVSSIELATLAQSGAIASLEFYPNDGLAPFGHGGDKWMTSAVGLASIQTGKVAYKEPDPVSAPSDSQRYFSVNLMYVDKSKSQVTLWLQVYAPGSKTVVEFNSRFDLGYFDLPMVENIRLSQGQRCAAVLTDLQEGIIRVSLVFFPGSRASLKDKPYYDEVLDELHKGKAQ